MKGTGEGVGEETKERQEEKEKRVRKENESGRGRQVTRRISLSVRRSVRQRGNSVCNGHEQCVCVCVCVKRQGSTK